MDSAVDLSSNGYHEGKLANGCHPDQLKLPTRKLPQGAPDDWKLHEPILAIDERDAATPDNWVPRHPMLIRLTGRCECRAFRTPEAPPRSSHPSSRSRVRVSHMCSFPVRL